MKIGTKSLLFGVHQVFIHPWFVAWAWWKLYGFPFDPRLWVAFIVHDWGYLGKPNMDRPEGEEHPHFAAHLMYRLFDHGEWTPEYYEWIHVEKGVPWRVMTREWLKMLRDGWRIVAVFETFTLLERKIRTGYWSNLCLYHSRFLSKRNGQRYSRLCAADKLAIGLTPAWLYLPMAWLSGELQEYMAGNGARPPAGERTARQWFADVRRYCTAWALEHKDGKEDQWTGTMRDLARNNEEDAV